MERLKEQLLKLEVQETDKEENKTIALGTSKLNYLDPRISVAWYVSKYIVIQIVITFGDFSTILTLTFRFSRIRRCKKYDIPIEKVYNKTQRSKFRWAIDMAGPDFVF